MGEVRPGVKLSEKSAAGRGGDRHPSASLDAHPAAAPKLSSCKGFRTLSMLDSSATIQNNGGSFCRGALTTP